MVRVQQPIGRAKKVPARLAGWVLGVALLVIVATFGVSLIRLDNSSDVANVVVAVVAAIGTVVVAFFGIHVADAGRRDAEAARARVRRLAAATDADQRAEIMSEDPPDVLGKPGSRVGL
jgi:uncharacterized protein YacL